SNFHSGHLLLILNVQIQYGAFDADFTRGVHLIIRGGSTMASLPSTSADASTLGIYRLFDLAVLGRLGS
ncbi:hypothetical protein, partial [Shewanella aquimarina]|uniref:hypothetical protein n=1 Tax=Shewanella aquimarina TaxID=260365 RepID=UPI002014E22D